MFDKSLFAWLAGPILSNAVTLNSLKIFNKLLKTSPPSLTSSEEGLQWLEEEFWGMQGFLRSWVRGEIEIESKLGFIEEKKPKFFPRKILLITLKREKMIKGLVSSAE